MITDILKVISNVLISLCRSLIRSRINFLLPKVFLFNISCSLSLLMMNSFQLFMYLKISLACLSFLKVIFAKYSL